VGDYRRRMIGTHLNAKFFDHSNQDNVAIRTSACNSALEDLINFMKLDGVRLAIYDATDVSRSRRKEILGILEKAEVFSKKIFLETICDDESVLKQHVQMVQASAPDYQNMDPQKVVEDYMERRSYYMNIYEPLDEGEGSFVKVFNNKKFVIHNIRGYLPLKVCWFILFNR
jgi:6-phosphofructo-2-kinase/fructose-2,6-biphosphatase 2